MTVAAVSPAAAPVVLVDLSAIYHAAWRVNSAEQPISVAFQATLDGVRRCANYRQGALVAVCLDSRTNWRKKLSPEYKSQRERLEASFYDCFDRVKARLRADGFLLWEAEGYEADDVIAAAVDGAVSNGHEVVICSADKDMVQLLKHDGVTMLRTSTWEAMDPATAQAKYLVPPSQMGDLLALVGDASDNVAGVDGIGPKTAAALLAAHGSIDGIYDAMKDGTIQLKGAKLEALQKGIENVELARKLVALRYDAPIRFDEIYEDRKQAPATKEIPPMPEATEAEFVDSVISKPPAQTKAEAPQVQSTAPAAPVAPTAMAAPVAPAPAEAAQPSRALALVPQPFELALEPQTPGQAVNLAARLNAARLFTWLANEDQVLAVIMRGREVGLSALVALETFKPVEGRLCPTAHFIIDRVEKDPNAEYFYCSETTPTSATYKTKHRKNPAEQSLTYTLAEAQAAGLVKPKSAWEKYPANMCRKMAGVFLGRMVYPGSALSLYAAEEMGVDGGSNE